MHLIGLMPARNEDWIIGLTTRAALLWVDELVVLNHCSTDDTAKILADVQNEYPGRVTILEDNIPVWREMAHRQRLLETARERGASHIALVDADEILTGNSVDSIRQHIEKTPAGEVMQLAWHCLWKSPYNYCSVSRHWAHAWVSFAFRDQANFHWETRNGYDFHHRHPMESLWGDYRPVLRSDGGLMHLQFVQWARLLSKQALYKMTEVLRWPERETISRINAKYDAASDESGAFQKTATPDVWWERYSKWMFYLNPQKEPWQVGECRRLMREHGAAKFAGLNLYGIC